MTIIDGKPFTQLTNLNILGELLVDGEPINVLPSPRTFYVQDGGDDTLNGKTITNPKLTVSSATTGVNALVPPSSVAAPTGIIVTGAGTFFENIVLPEGCQLLALEAIIFSPTGDCITPGSNAQTQVLAVANSVDSTSVYRVVSKTTVGIRCSSLNIFGTNSHGVFINGTSDNIYVNINQLSVQGAGSIGIRDETTIVGAPEYYNVDELTLEANNTTGILYNPDLSGTEAIVQAGLIGTVGSFSGTTGIDVQGGRIDAVVNEVVADTAIHVGSGAILDLIGNVIDGDIVVDAGGTLNCRVITHRNGTLTNNGTIIGFIGTDHFGNLIFQNDITIKENLLVQGTTTFENVTNLSVADRYINLNAGYETQAAITSGISANYLPLATNDDISGGTFIAGVASSSNPSVNTVGSNTFTSGQIIQIFGTFIGGNDGIYEVDSHVGTLLTIRGIGITPTVEDFSRNQFTSNALDNASIRHITVSVLRTSLAGVIEHGLGSTTPVTFNVIDSMYNSDGTVTEDRVITAENSDTITFNAYNGTEAVHDFRGTLLIQDQEMIMEVFDGANDLMGEISIGQVNTYIRSEDSSTNEQKLTLSNDTTDATFLDTINTKGIVYFTDRSIIDKAYADSVSIYASDGSLTGDRILTGTTFNLILRSQDDPTFTARKSTLSGNTCSCKGYTSSISIDIKLRIHYFH